MHSWLLSFAKIVSTLCIAVLGTAIVEAGALWLLFELMYHGKAVPENDLGAGFAVFPLAAVILFLGFPLFLFLGWNLTEKTLAKLGCRHRPVNSKISQPGQT